MSAPADSELIQAVQRRDPSAMMALYDRYRGIAFALAYRILDDAGAAEEAVQDAFLQVWRRAASYDPARGSGVRPWLLTIVRHRAIDHHRRRAGRAQPMINLDAIDVLASGADVFLDVSAGLEREQVRAAVASLPPAQRDAIVLAYFDGLTHQEIAERTSTPLGTVKGRLRLGLRKLAELLADPGRTA